MILSDKNLKYLSCATSISFLRNFHIFLAQLSYLSCATFISFLRKTVVVFVQDVSKLQQDDLIIRSINMNYMKNTMERKILLMTESKKLFLMKSYLLRM